MCPHEESNLDFNLRRVALYPLSYGDDYLYKVSQIPFIFNLTLSYFEAKIHLFGEVAERLKAARC